MMRLTLTILVFVLAVLGCGHQPPVAGERAGDLIPPAPTSDPWASNRTPPKKLSKVPSLESRLDNVESDLELIDSRLRSIEQSLEKTHRDLDAIIKLIRKHFPREQGVKPKASK